MFSALRHRNFRIYLAGQFVSMIGTWMQQLAMEWLTYRLTGSATWLGVVSFASQIPMFALGPVTGVWVDRAEKRRLLLWTQGLLAVQALVLTVLDFTGHVPIAVLVALSLIQGSINAFDMPGRQAFVIEMIGDRRDLQNAIALNSSVMNGTRLLGPAIAGFTIAALGEGACFLLNAISYLAVLFALLAMQVNEHGPARAGIGILESLAEGWEFAMGSRSIRDILLFLSFLSLVAFPYTTLFPAIAGQILHGNAATLGWISAAAGFGALLGALSLARRATPHGMGRLIGLAALLFGLALIALAFVRSLPLILLSLLAAGLGMFLPMASGNTVIQTLVHDDKRGRVMSFFTFSLIGISPIGSLLMGWAANRFGLPQVLAAGGVLVVLGVAVFLRQARGVDATIDAQCKLAHHPVHDA